MKKAFLILFFTTFYSRLFIFAYDEDKSKVTDQDKTSLEGILVEKYYVSELSDATDSSKNPLPKGAVTYRIYVDMKPNYTLQLVYGNKKHPLVIKTSTNFFNNPDCGALIGYNVNFTKLNDNTVALDSWITINSATNNHAGVLKTEDKDGSFIKRRTLDKTDGLTNGNLPLIKPFNLDLNFFNKTSGDSVFTTTNGGWAAMSGIKSGAKGPNSENKVLIAQLTTNGKLSFDLNIQLGTPEGKAIQFVSGKAEGYEIKFDGLSLK